LLPYQRPALNRCTVFAAATDVVGVLRKQVV
jgi:hypothetical protein